MAVELKTMLEKFIREYAAELAEARRTEDFKRPFGALVRQDIAKLLQDKVDSSIYKVKGSVGAGRWTDVPWIAVFDTRITTSAQRGVYIVYLLNKDTKELFLTLNQGATDVAQGGRNASDGRLAFTGIASSSSDKTTGDLKEKANNIRNKLRNVPNLLSGEIKTGSVAYDAGCIFFKKYELNSLPNDEQLYSDLLKFIEVYGAYYNDVFLKENFSSDGDEWWPSYEDYPVDITKDDWKKYILEIELPNHPAPMKMLKGMMELAGEASCKQLSETYGGHPSAYSGCAMNLGRRVKKYFNLQPCMDGDQERYFPFPFVGKYRGGSEDNYLYRIRTELYEALKEIDLSSIDPNYERGEEQLSTKEILQRINTYIAAQGFTFDEGLVENYYLSLKSKPFVILAGTSGTGKTRLVRLFAEAIGATTENGRYKLVSVRPDWSDSSDLFGHVDLNGKFVPGAIIDFINAAEWDSDKPYFLCLDEMNLARVEYYLSDILSIIETRGYKEGRITTDPLVLEHYYGADTGALEKYGEIRIPENMYIVGTVNMDETTFPFSRKVLDRANTIEFSTVDFLSAPAIPLNEVQPMNLGNDFMKADYVFFRQCASEETYVNELCVELQEINKVLEKANAHVGYRVRDEIVFYMLNNKNAGLLNRNEAFDNEIMQKILPRIQGSSATVKNMLCELFKRCAGEYESYQTESDDISSKMLKAAQKAECKYRKSAEKIAFMVRRFEEDGFTAYWL